jgi:hypothetical protein
MTDDIVQRLRAFDNGYVGTHYDDCWHYHPICAILRAADEIERLSELVLNLRDFIDVDDEDYDG